MITLNTQKLPLNNQSISKGMMVLEDLISLCLKNSAQLVNREGENIQVSEKIGLHKSAYMYIIVIRMRHHLSYYNELADGP